MEIAWKYAIFITMTSFLMKTEATHFRGGTISWKSLGGTKVEFDFKLGWVYDLGPGCMESKIGQFVSNHRMSKYFWKCSSGCPTKTKIASVDYTCTDANKKEKWEQGQHSFTYDFPNKGPFIVSLSARKWIALSVPGKGKGDWYVATSVVLGTRSDTGRVNSSPVFTSKLVYHARLGCDAQLRLPVIDPDGDKLRCRWSPGKQYIKLHNALPGAVLDETECTIQFNATTGMGYQDNGLYAVALTIEDYPRTPLAMGTSKKTSSDALSLIPVQFMIETRSSTKSCYEKPQFVPPSPSQNQVITAEEGDRFTVDLYADNGNDTAVNITSITVTGIFALTASPITEDTNRTNTFMTTLTWNTTTKDIGDHLVCAGVTDDDGMLGDERCFKIAIVSNGCKSNPCKNGATCNSNKGIYGCTCSPGFKGTNCGNRQNDCMSTPCNNGGVCTNTKMGYSCKCHTGWKGKACNQTDQRTSEPVSITPTVVSQTTLMDLVAAGALNTTDSCPEYQCQCVYSQGKKSTKAQNNMRNVLVGFFAFIFGLAMSVPTYRFTYRIFNYMVARCMEIKCKTGLASVKDKCKTGLESGKNKCKTGLESVKNKCKTGLQSGKNKCKTGLGSVKNKCKTGLESVKNKCKLGPKSALEPTTGPIDPDLPLAITPSPTESDDLSIEETHVL